MPSINGGMKLIKYLLFLFNLAFVFLGITLIWVGFSVKNGFTKYFGFIIGEEDGGHSIPPTIFIAVGFIMFIIAFLGCCGAVTENHCMMMLYSVLVGIILVIQLGGAIAAYAFQDDVERALSTSLEKSMNEYWNNESPSKIHNDTVTSWNFLQHNLKCCGVHNYTDWANATQAPETEFIPISCCKDGDFDHCTQTITRANLHEEAEAAKIIYTQGCLPKGIVQVSINNLGTLGIVFAAIEVLGIICACMMARSIRFSYETV